MEVQEGEKGKDPGSSRGVLGQELWLHTDWVSASSSEEPPLLPSSSKVSDITGRTQTNIRECFNADRDIRECCENKALLHVD